MELTHTHKEAWQKLFLLDRSLDWKKVNREPRRESRLFLDYTLLTIASTFPYSAIPFLDVLFDCFNSDVCPGPAWNPVFSDLSYRLVSINPDRKWGWGGAGRGGEWPEWKEACVFIGLFIKIKQLCFSQACVVLCYFKQVSYIFKILIFIANMVKYK